MKTRMFLLTLAVGAMMFTACKKDSSSPTPANEIRQYFNQMVAFTGMTLDSASTILKNDGYELQLATTNEFMKEVKGISYYIKFETTFQNIILQETMEFTTVSDANNTLIGNDANYMELLESMTARYILASQDTAYFRSFGCDSYGSGGIDGFADMVGGHRQQMMAAQHSSACWDHETQNYENYNKNCVTINRDFLDANRATGGKLSFKYRNEAISKPE